MKSYKKYLLLAVIALGITACVDNVPVEEELPQDAVSFTYHINGDYALDYYVGSVITFTSTSPTEGTPVWNFGDGKTAEGKTVEYLKEGGFLAIVLPDGILTNSSMQYVRTQIEDWKTHLLVV